MRDKIFRISCLLIALLFNLQDSFGQLTTVNINTNKDSYVNSQLPDQNFGTDTLIKSGTVKPRFLGPFYQRVFTEFDLSSIPPNAVIYSAKIKMKVYSGIYGSNPFRTKLVTSTWSENTITLNNQPSISTDAGDISSSYTVSNDTVSFDVTDMAQRMVYSQISNYGWSIQVLDETYSGLTGATFWSREYSNYIPTLEVKYFLPLTISNVVITHESTAAANDGAINLTVNNGSQSFTYDWYNSSGTLISTSTTSPQITDLNFGWYGLHVTGSLGEELYYAFLIGTQCEEVTINFETSPNYTDNAFLYNLIYGSTNYGDNNYGDYVYLKSQRWTYSGNWMSGKSLLKLNVWMDPAFTVNQADITMYGSAHSTLGGSNDAEFNLVTEEWDQNRVTWNTAPSVSDSIDVNIAATSSSTENKTVDIKEYWNHWKKNNSQNYGMVLQLQNFNNYYHEQRYHSPAASITSNRPDVVFKLELIPDSYTTMIWDTVNQLGEIQIDISESCISHSAPLKYMIATDTIHDLTELYNYIKDSVLFGSLDSTNFFNGTSETTYSFYNLESNKYIISIFDSTWSRVWSEEVIVQGDLKIESQGNLNLENNIISTGQSDAKGELSLYTENGMNSELTAEISSTYNEQLFGYIHIDSSLINYSSLEYGFYLKDDTVWTVDRGVLSAGFQLANSNSVLKILIVDNNLKCYLDETVILTKSLTGIYTYKVGVGIQPQGSIKIYSNKLLFKKPKYRFNKAVNNFLCEGTQGNFSFFIDPFVQGGPFQVIYNLKNENGDVVISNASTSSNYWALIDQNDLSLPLDPGIYSLYGTIQTTPITSVPISFFKRITVGYESVWEERDTEYTLNPNSYSLLVSGHDELAFVKARSSNVLNNSDKGWVEFVPVINQGGNYFRFTSLDINSQPSPAILNEDFIVFIKFLNLKLMISYSGTSVTPGIVDLSSVSPTSKVQLIYSTSAPTVNIYRDYYLIGQMDRGNYSILNRFNSIKNNDGFKNVISSYSCRTIENQYAHLKYKLDGYYHIMQKGEINFLYNQEYDADPLTFNIYDAHDELVMNQNYFGVINTTNGDNYLTIDVSDDLHCLGPGFFYLEVLNSKKERMYLRFYNNYDGCTQ